MKKELPYYVFDKKYEYFYLYTEFDILFNKEFTKKLEKFSQKIGVGNLSIDLEVPKEYSSLIPNRIDISKEINLDNFYEITLNINGNDLSYYMMNFFICDDSMQWEIYVSLENELSIFACSKEINSLLEVIFSPYAEENIEQKYKIIGDMFGNEELKLKFIESLEQNYNFSNNNE